MRTKLLLAFLILLTCELRTMAQDGPATSLLLRRYHDGEKLIYRIKGVNEGEPYEATATGLVKTDSSGRHFEEYAWSNLVKNGGGGATV